MTILLDLTIEYTIVEYNSFFGVYDPTWNIQNWICFCNLCPRYVDHNSLLTQHEIWLWRVNPRRQVTDILRLDMEPAEANEEAKPAGREDWNDGTTTNAEQGENSQFRVENYHGS